MIQAEKPENLQNPDEIQSPTPAVTKVHGFSTPTEKIAEVQQTAQTTQHIKPQALHEGTHTNHWQATFFHWWHKIALVLLVGHGLLGLWESIAFMIFEYPELNTLLEEHLVTTEEVNHLLARVIITVVVTFVNILFAVRLAKVKETTAHNIDLIVATFLIITTRFIQNFLFQLDLLNLFLRLIS